MQPRGPTEREDFKALRDFFDAHPARPEDITEAPTPKSHFDWDDNSDISSPRQLETKNLRSFQRATKRVRATNNADVRTTGHSSHVFGMGPSVDDWMQCARFYAQEKRVDQAVQSSPASDGSLQRRRTSVLKLFSDPVWKDEDVPTPLPRKSDASASALCSNSTTDVHELPVSKFATLPNGFRYIDWSPANREHAAHSPCMTPLMMPGKSSSDMRHANEGNDKSSPKIPDPERLTPSLAETPPSSKAGAAIPLVQHKRPKLPASWVLADSSVVIPTRASDPFLEEGNQAVSSNLNIMGSAKSLDTQMTYHALTTPTRQEKRKHQMTPSLAEPSGVATPSTSSVRQLSIATALPLRSSNDQTPTRHKGYPKGPEDPEWDAAVKRVKKIVQAQEKREALEARQQQKEWNAMEKKAQKLKAGRTAILRGSQFGLATRKPIDEMTEDEIEAMGSFATAPVTEAPLSKKASILGSIFTKVKGSPREQNARVEQTNDQLDKHKSLEFLFIENSPDLNMFSEEDLGHYDEVLRLLKCSSSSKYDSNPSPFDTSTPRSLSSARNVEHENAACRFKEGHEVWWSQEATPIGLGISTDYPEHSQNTNTPENSLPYPRATLPPSLEPFNSHTAELPQSSHHSTFETAEVKDDSSWHTESVRTMDSMSSPDDYQPCTETFSPQQHHDGHLHNGDLSKVQIADPEEDRTSTYSDQAADPNAVPLPLNIRVLKVKPSLTDIRSPNPNSFVPDRQASFRVKIQEASRLQQVVIGSRSHPALRTKAENQSGPMPSSNTCPSPTVTNHSPNLLISPSGLVHQQPRRLVEEIDKGYAIGPLQQNGLEEEGYGMTKQACPPVNPSPTWQNSSPSMKSMTSEHPSQDVDVQTLRAEVGLDPLRLACGSNSVKHPHHPFTWNHEKVMCRQIHNPMEFLPSMPALPKDSQVSFSSMDSRYFNDRPSKRSVEEAKMCQSCGAFCCRFANLIVTSKIKTGGDVAEEMVRVKAQQRVDQLRSQHPNGVEDYETFVVCNHCGSEVCPGCAKRCNEVICQAVVCNGCASEADQCPVHNFV